MAVLLTRRLRAIDLLIEGGLAPEAETLARGLLEATLNLSWVGDSEERALPLRAKGPSDQVPTLAKRARAAGN